MKPIIQVKESSTYNYKNCFTAYALGFPIKFVTDLDKEEFENYIDGTHNFSQKDGENNE